MFITKTLAISIRKMEVSYYLKDQLLVKVENLVIIITDDLTKDCSHLKL